MTHVQILHFMTQWNQSWISLLLLLPFNLWRRVVFSLGWFLDNGQLLEGGQGKSFCSVVATTHEMIMLSPRQEGLGTVNSRINSYLGEGRRSKRGIGSFSVETCLATEMGISEIEWVSSVCLHWEENQENPWEAGSGLGSFLWSCFPRDPPAIGRVSESRLRTANDAATSWILPVSGLTWESKPGFSFPSCSRERCNLTHLVARPQSLLLGFIMSQGLPMENCWKAISAASVSVERRPLINIILSPLTGW